MFRFWDGYAVSLHPYCTKNTDICRQLWGRKQRVSKRKRRPATAGRLFCIKGAFIAIWSRIHLIRLPFGRHLPPLGKARVCANFKIGMLIYNCLQYHCRGGVAPPAVGVLCPRNVCGANISRAVGVFHISKKYFTCLQGQISPWPTRATAYSSLIVAGARWWRTPVSAMVASASSESSASSSVTRASISARSAKA